MTNRKACRIKTSSLILYFLLTYNFIYPLNYGYIPNTVAGDGKEIDAYILGEDIPLKEYEGKVIAVIRRKNDNENKLVVSNRNFTTNEIKSSLHFQEQYFETEIITIS